MSRFLGVLTALGVPLLSAGMSHAADGAALLTVSGNVATTNRGPFDAFHDGYLNYHGHVFVRAFEFNAAALDALPQQEIVADAEPWPTMLAMSGPLLADVLSAAGATGKPLTVYAMDGYGAAMTPDQVAARPWVLATHAGGKALGIGGRGPLWLVYDTAARKATAQEEAAWIWSVFHIVVGE